MFGIRNSVIIKNSCLALVLIGNVVGMYMNQYVSMSSWSNIVMIVAILGLINWGNLLGGKFPLFNPKMKLILFFQIACIIYYYFFPAWGDASYSMYYSKYLYYHVFLIFMIFAVSSNDITIRINIDIFAVTTWILTTICSAFFLYSITHGMLFTMYADLDTLNVDWRDQILEPITMCNACSLNIIASLFLPKFKFSNIVVVTSILLDINLIVFTGKRTPLFVAFVAILFYFIKTKAYKSFFSSKGFSFFIVAIIAAVVVFSTNETLGDRALETLERFFNGIYDFLNGTQTSGESASARYEFRKWATDYINNDFTFLNYIFGGGYMVKFLDAPLLQAYLDEGIWGVCIYVWAIFLLPLKYIKNITTDNKLMFLGCLICCQQFTSLFAHNQYEFGTWVPAILLLFFESIVKSQANMMYEKKN